MSFFLDTFLLYGLGHLLALVRKKTNKKYSFLIYPLYVLALLGFYIMSIGLFCDYHMFGGLIENPTQFMYGSGIFEVPFDSFEELVLPKNRMWVFLGILLFCTYPFWLWMGVEMGRVMFGKRKGQKGVFGLLG